MRKNFSFLALILFLILSSFLFFYLGLDNSLRNTIFFAALEAVGAILGLFGLIYQENENQKIQSAKFIVDLNQNYLNDISHQELIDLLESSDNLELNRFALNNAVQHLDFFEPICVLVEKKIIDIDFIDDLFSYRFFRVVNDKRIQEQILDKNPQSFRNIIYLHYIWKKHRIKADKSVNIPCAETDLSLQNWYWQIIKRGKQ